FSLSSDGKQVAYNVGKELFSQSITGSEPKLLAADSWQPRPDWHPDGTRIAYTAIDRSIVVVDLEGTSLITIPSPPAANNLLSGAITEIRWSPDGTRLAFLLRNTLYVVDADGQHLHPITFKNDGIAISTFAWSPDGDRFAFRSNFEAGEKCKFNLVFRFEAG